MKEASSGLDYEDAALYRDILNGLKHMSERILTGEYKEEKINSALLSADRSKDLAKVLGLKTPPLHIEAFDNSHLYGRHAVGGMVCFINGKKNHAHYRRFKIQTPAAGAGADDFAMMEEIVYRRLRALKKTPADMPDLMLIDGGKGQLAAALSAARRAKVKMHFAALAKREEEIFVPGRARGIRLEMNSPALLLLIEIRNEVHRFGVSYHRFLRGKELAGEMRGKK
jgi:excinuclease ABC subunit C